MFADVSATDVIACAAGTSPAVTAAAISFSNPSKELLEPLLYHLAKYRILCSVLLLTATCAIKKSENFGGNVWPRP